MELRQAGWNMLACCAADFGWMSWGCDDSNTIPSDQLIWDRNQTGSSDFGTSGSVLSNLESESNRF